jgi:hypothetical protein
MHWVVDVGNRGDVEMHASLTFAPAASWTAPVIVTVGFGLADVVGVAVRVGTGVAGRSVSTWTGVLVGTARGVSVRAGVGDTTVDGWTAGSVDGAGDSDRDGELAGDGVGGADGTGFGRVVSSRGMLPSSSTTASDADVRALAAAPGWPAASCRAASSVRDCTRSRR